MNKRAISSLINHYTEFVIQIIPRHHDNWKICDKLGHYLTSGWSCVNSPLVLITQSWCKHNLQVCHLFLLTLFEACSELDILFCGLFLFPISLLDPGAVLSSTTSIASSATLVLVATIIGGDLVFDSFAGLIFTDVRNPPIFDFNWKHSFRRFCQSIFKNGRWLILFSPSLWQCPREHILPFELLTSYPGGTPLRPPGIFVGTYFCCSPSFPFL